MTANSNADQLVGQLNGLNLGIDFDFLKEIDFAKLAAQVGLVGVKFVTDDIIPTMIEKGGMLATLATILSTILVHLQTWLAEQAK